jgi:hypothetical protein
MPSNEAIAVCSHDYMKFVPTVWTKYKVLLLKWARGGAVG